MATKKKVANPPVDPALAEEVHEAVEEAVYDAKTGVLLKQPKIVSINSNLDPDQIHLRDSRSE